MVPQWYNAWQLKDMGSGLHFTYIATTSGTFNLCGLFAASYSARSRELLRPHWWAATVYDGNFEGKMWASAGMVMMNTKGLALQSSSPSHKVWQGECTDHELLLKHGTDLLHGPTNKLGENYKAVLCTGLIRIVKRSCSLGCPRIGTF